MLLRHLAAILLLPFVVVVVVPSRLVHGVVRPEWPRAVVGAGLFGLGLLLFGWCLILFARLGHGTLAPWDPTRRLVAVGPYRHVRNPMISGVALMLLGEATAADSRSLALWAAGFVLINHLYFLLAEEPGLERRFGDAYRVYRANVPRWVPRPRPWRGPPEAADQDRHTAAAG